MRAGDRKKGRKEEKERKRETEKEHFEKALTWLPYSPNKRTVDPFSVRLFRPRGVPI